MGHVGSNPTPGTTYCTISSVNVSMSKIFPWVSYEACPRFLINLNYERYYFLGILDTPIGRKKSPSSVKDCVKHLATALEQGWQLR